MKGRKDTYIAIAIVVAALIIAFQPGEPGVLSVNGNGEVAAAPDTAGFSFYVDALRPGAGEAKAVVDSAQQAIVAKLVAAGVPRENIQTQSYSLRKEQRWSNGSYVDLGWRARSSLSVETGNVGNVGKLVDAVAANGGELGGQIRFYIRDDSALREKALAEAVAEAKEKAKAAAESAGVRLVRIKSITPGYNYYPVYRALSAEGANIEPGEEKMSATVSIIYEVA